MTTAKDVIRDTINNSDFIIKTYLQDLTDADLLVSPVEGMNPVAWQLGHLTAVERSWVEKLRPGSCPALPEGFAEAHTKETAVPHAFKPAGNKADYVKAWDAQHAATLAVLDALPEARLTEPTGVDFAPTVASMLNMIGVHGLMHCGQIVALRRKLGKPVVI
jgi:uncharacterized damage-inducible protein DinB